MSGELDLTKLLQTLKAELQPGVYVFVTLEETALPQDLQPRMLFREAEGVTLICLREEADAHGLAFEFPSRMITLDVHSALEAVGFIAHIATALAAEGMGVNPVAGFYHDHLFVPEGREDDALRILDDVARAARTSAV